MPEKQRKEKLDFVITKAKSSAWEHYKKYHYLNDCLPPGHYYEVFLNDKKVGFLSINTFPHPIAKDIMTISRIVIVPEFQGFGIGVKMMNEIAEIYKQKRKRIRITTSLKSFIKSLKKQKKWKCVRFGRVGQSSSNGIMHNKKNKSHSLNRITATFEMI